MILNNAHLIVLLTFFILILLFHRFRCLGLNIFCVKLVLFFLPCFLCLFCWWGRGLFLNHLWLRSRLLLLWLKRVHKILKSICILFTRVTESHKRCYCNKNKCIMTPQTSLKASRRSPTSFLFRSLIFFFFFGTIVGAARKIETRVKHEKEINQYSL